MTLIKYIKLEFEQTLMRSEIDTSRLRVAQTDGVGLPQNAQDLNEDVGIATDTERERE